MESLYDTTRDLHHACEMHLVGGAMSDGTVIKQWWADWLHALYLIHLEIDGDPRDDLLARFEEIEIDIKGSPVSPRGTVIGQELADKLHENEKLRLAARYVITGAHLMGGQVMRKRIAGRLPCAHLHHGHRKELIKEWSPLRKRTDLTPEAREVFQYLLWIMDEILIKDLGPDFL